MIKINRFPKMKNFDRYVFGLYYRLKRKASEKLGAVVII